MYYVAMDVGCIECGESSAVLGIFTDEEKAKKVIDSHHKRAHAFACGEHRFFIEEFEDINETHRVTYDMEEA